MPYLATKFGLFLTHRKQFIQIEDTKKYIRARVQLHWKGIVLRDEVEGALIKTKDQQIARQGELLVAEIDAKVGGVGIVPPELDRAIVSSHYFLFEIDESKCLRRWLDWFIRSGGLGDQFAARGSTNYAAIRPHHILNCEIPLPSLDEQDRIVSRIQALANKLEQARCLRHHAFQQANTVSQAVTSRIFDDLTHCPEVPIGTMGRSGTNPVQTGPFGAQLHSSDFVDEGIPVLNVGNVWPEGLRFDRLDHVLPAKAEQLNRYLLKSNDLLFARSGATLGKVCVVPKQCDGWLMTGHLFRVRFDETRCLPHFAFAALRGARSVLEQVFGAIRGATRPGFNTTLLSRVRIPLPPLDEQQGIVSHLDRLQGKVHTIKRLQTESAAELGALLPSVLSKAFRGEL